jgi:hypothetical protein
VHNPSLKFFVLFAVLICLVGCASTQQYTARVESPDLKLLGRLKPAPGKAKICVVRRSSFMGAGIAIDIADTGRPIGRVGSGGKLIWERDPGTVVIGASASNEANITVTAKAGEVYFVEARTNWGAGFNTAACEIRLLSASEGMIILNELERWNAATALQAVTVNTPEPSLLAKSMRERPMLLARKIFSDSGRELNQFFQFIEDFRMQKVSGVSWSRTECDIAECDTRDRTHARARGGELLRWKGEGEGASELVSSKRKT